MKQILRSAFFSGASLLLLCMLPTAAFAEGQNDVPILDEDSQELETHTSGDYTYSILLNTEDSGLQAACIEEYTGKESELVIPSKLDGLDVVALGDQAFAGNSLLTAVTIPASCVALGEYTFAECTNIKRFDVEAGNTYFESKDGVLYEEEGKLLSRYPIAACPAELVIPDGVTALGNCALAYSKRLSSVTFPEGFQTLGQMTFSDCTALKSITIPDDVTVIPKFCFYRCSALAEIQLPDPITEIGDAAFAATALEHFQFPKSCTTIGQAAFAATKLKEIVIPSTVTSIGYSAFGWKMDTTGAFYRDTEFVIRGVAESEAERYAKDTENGNDFTFVSITEEEAASKEESSKETEESGTAPSDSPTASTPISTGRLVGILLSCVLIVGIIGIGIFITVRERKQGKEK